MNNNYKIENWVRIIDWILVSDPLPIDNNFDKLLKGFIETPGRIVQPSYNFYVSFSLNYLYLIICLLYLTILHNIKNMTYQIYFYFIFLDVQLLDPYNKQCSISWACLTG